jgi:hypothetical protein
MHHLDPWRVAKMLIDHKGAERAMEHATRRVEDLELAGDDEGAVVWRLVMAAIEALSAGAREEEARH